MSSPWSNILSRSADVLAALKRRSSGPRVLYATSVGGNAAVTALDSLVAMALWLRGADVRVLLCDGQLAACEACTIGMFPDLDGFVKAGPQASVCHGCFKSGSDFFEPLPVEIQRYSQWVRVEEILPEIEKVGSLSIEECFTLHRNGLHYGEQVRAGVLRFFGKANFAGERSDQVLAITRRYAASALIAANAAEHILDSYKPEVVVAHHGIYVPQGIIGMVARARGIRVAHYGISYRDTTVIFSHDDTYHKTFMTEPPAKWENRILSKSEEDLVDRYLVAKRLGKGDWTWIGAELGKTTTINDPQVIARELEIDRNRPCICMLTNVLWDAQLYYRTNAFPNMLEWVTCTVDYFAKRPEMQLIIRIHPHETKLSNRQPTAAEILARYPRLPENIRIVDKDKNYSTYALVDISSAVLIYGTKAGVELSCSGVPIITAGDAWIRGKGITHDAHTRQEYETMLENLATLPKLNSETVARARRYAFHYFFRRMIPIASFAPKASFPPVLKIENIRPLLPPDGASAELIDRGVDVICRGILEERDFYYEPQGTDFELYKESIPLC